MSNNQIHIATPTHHSSLITHHLIIVAALAGVVAAAGLCAVGRYREAMAAALAAVAIGFIFSARVKIETILIAWFATAPLVSYFVRIPTDRSIITFNRAVFGLAVVALFVRWRRSKTVVAKPEAQVADSNSAIKNLKQSISAAAVRFEIAWAAVSVVALASAILYAYDTAFAARIAVDSFLLPLAAFHIARRHFDLRGRAGLLLVGAVGLAFFLLAVGAYEVATGANLFQYKGSVIEREGELRINGPFSADVTYANISLLLALFLTAAPRVFNARLDSTAQMLRTCAIGAAIISSLLPMFRTVAAALVIGLIVLKAAIRAREKRRGDTGTRRLGDTDFTNESITAISQTVSPSLRVAPTPRRVARRWLALVLLAAAIGVVMFGPLSFEERLRDPRNAFGRLATWEAAAAIAFEQPLTGVGFTNYGEYFYERRRREDRWVETFMSTRAANSPHSNWLWIASELGLVTFAIYVMANASLFLVGYRALKKARAPHSRAAAACFIALVVAYWIPGLTLASGYYSDLNLYFFFMLGLLSNSSEQ